MKTFRPEVIMAEEGKESRDREDKNLDNN